MTITNAFQKAHVWTQVVCIALLCVSAVRAQTPVVFPGGLVNAASFRPANASGGSVAPGSIVSIFGTNLATAVAQAANLPLPTELLGTRATIAGKLMPLFFASPSQINAQIPWGTATGTVQLTVQTPSGSSQAIAVGIQQSAPAVFTQASSGRGPGAVLNYVTGGATPLNTSASTIDSNGIIIFFGTGFGPVSNPPGDGSAGAAQRTLVPPSVSIGGRPAIVDFSGLAPGYVGLYQVNARVPAGTPDGCYVPLSVSFGDAISNAVTIAVNHSLANCNQAATGSMGPGLNGSFAITGINQTSYQSALPLPIPPPSKPGALRASFRRWETRMPALDAGLPPADGGCSTSIIPYNETSPPDPTLFLVRDKPLDAGMLTLSGPFTGSPTTIASKESGEYELPLGVNGLAPGTWKLSSSGGPNVGPFSASLSVPAGFEVFSYGVQNGMASRSSPLFLMWFCPDRNAQIAVSMMSTHAQNKLAGIATCTFVCAIQQGIVPPDVLSQLPASSEFGASVIVIFQPDLAHTPRVQAAGLDLGWFSYSFSSILQGATLQ